MEQWDEQFRASAVKMKYSSHKALESAGNCLPRAVFKKKEQELAQSVVLAFIVFRSTRPLSMYIGHAHYACRITATVLPRAQE